MINFRYVPTRFTLMEMTEAFLEEAEVEYENAQIDRLSEAQIESLKFRMDACKARHTLARNLMDQLVYEIENPKDSMIVPFDDSTPISRLTFESVSDWANDKFGIDISEWTQIDESQQNADWNDVTIKIYADYRVGYSSGDQYKRSSFLDIGLMGKRKNEPNYLGGILIGLSNGEKYPPGQRPEPRNKTAISKLRNRLKKLTGITSDPFYEFNEGGGWKPRFKLLDDRRNAEERAKREAKHVPYNDDMSDAETLYFEREDDDGQDYLDQHSDYQ